MLPRKSISAALRLIKLELSRGSPNIERAQAAIAQIYDANQPGEFNQHTLLTEITEPILSIRELGALEKIHVETVGELLACEEKDFHKLRNVGPVQRRNFVSAKEYLASKLAQTRQQARDAERLKIQRAIHGVNG